MKTIVRILFNKLVKTHASSFQYPLLDIGGGAMPSYAAFLQNEQRYIVDCNPKLKGNKNTVILNLDKQITITVTQKYKTIIAYNFFEHVFNHDQILKNIRSLMTKDAALHVFIPFLIPYHPDPQDYVRFTETGITTVLNKSGFKIRSLSVIGGYFTLILQYLQYCPFIGGCFIVLLPVARFLDYCISLKLRDTYSRRYVLGYYVVAKKA